jgi:hypothetical protein
MHAGEKRNRGVATLLARQFVVAVLSSLCLWVACKVPEGSVADSGPISSTPGNGLAVGSAEAGAAERVRDLFDPVRMASGLEGVRFGSETTLNLEPAAEGIVLKDRRRLVRNPAGDFDLEIVRIHEGSQAGDTSLAIRAVRRGDDYWTRGTAGPFVHWDDARDEPAVMEASVVETTIDLLMLASRCGGLRDDGSGWIVDVSTPCRPPDNRSRTRYVTEVLRLAGRVSPNPVGGYDVDIEGLVGGRVGGRSGQARITHHARLEDIGSAPEIEVPAESIPSRRDRPVRRVRSVLRGWDDSLGPGYPGGEGPVN